MTDTISLPPSNENENGSKNGSKNSGSISYFRQQFEREKNITLSRIPDAVKKSFRRISYANWKGAYFPVLEISPYDVEPGPVRDEWKTMFRKTMREKRPPSRLIYWYGKTWNDRPKSYSFVHKSKLKSLNEGIALGFDAIPPSIRRKLDDDDEDLTPHESYHVAALNDYKRDLRNDPNDRMAWMLRFKEDYVHREERHFSQHGYIPQSSNEVRDVSSSSHSTDRTLPDESGKMKRTKRKPSDQAQSLDDFLQDFCSYDDESLCNDGGGDEDEDDVDFCDEAKLYSSNRPKRRKRRKRRKAAADDDDDSLRLFLERFQRREKEILADIPPTVTNRFRQIAFTQFKHRNNYLPVLEISPYDVEPGIVRQQWYRMYLEAKRTNKAPKRLIFWYGYTWDNKSEAYSFMPDKWLTSMEEGIALGYDEIPELIQKKIDGGKPLNAAQRFHLAALRQFKIDKDLDPEERIEWMMRFQEEDYASNKRPRSSKRRKANKEKNIVGYVDYVMDNNSENVNSKDSCSENDKTYLKSCKDEQDQFEECEKIILPIISYMKDAIAKNDATTALHCIKKMLTQVTIITAPFMEHYKPHTVVKELKDVMKETNPKVSDWGKLLFNRLKMSYKAKLDYVPEGFTPIIRNDKHDAITSPTSPLDTIPLHGSREGSQSPSTFKIKNALHNRKTNQPLKSTKTAAGDWISHDPKEHRSVLKLVDKHEKVCDEMLDLMPKMSIETPAYDATFLSKHDDCSTSPSLLNNKRKASLMVTAASTDGFVSTTKATPSLSNVVASGHVTDKKIADTEIVAVETQEMRRRSDTATGAIFSPQSQKNQRVDRCSSLCPKNHPNQIDIENKKGDDKQKQKQNVNFACRKSDVGKAVTNEEKSIIFKKMCDLVAREQKGGCQEESVLKTKGGKEDDDEAIRNNAATSETKADSDDNYKKDRFSLNETNNDTTISHPEIIDLLSDDENSTTFDDTIDNDQKSNFAEESYNETTEACDDTTTQRRMGPVPHHETLSRTSSPKQQYKAQKRKSALSPFRNKQDEEQCRFEECERVILDILSSMKRSIRNDDVKLAKWSIRAMTLQTNIITAPFMDHYKPHAIVKGLISQFETRRPKLSELGRGLYRELKRAYHDDKKYIPKDFVPIVGNIESDSTDGNPPLSHHQRQPTSSTTMRDVVIDVDAPHNNNNIISDSADGNPLLPHHQRQPTSSTMTQDVVINVDAPHNNRNNTARQIAAATKRSWDPHKIVINVDDSTPDVTTTTTLQAINPADKDMMLQMRDDYDHDTLEGFLTL